MEKADWKKLVIRPDASIDERQFEEQMAKNGEAWQAALDFLSKEGLSSLENGRHELSAGAYATVSEYETKDPAVARYEVHRKYIDIQYIVAGEEYIEVLPMAAFKEKQDYNEVKDIAFFTENPEGKRLHADPASFFVFFPDEVHKPGLRINTAGKIKKIVVKIPVK